MNRVRFLSAFLLCAVLLTGCGGEKEDKSSVKLPQQISYFDGAVTFSLPDAWVSVVVPDSPDLAFVVVNSQTLYDDTENKDLFVNLAPGAFAYAYDPSINMNDVDLAVKENVAIGMGMAVPLTGQDAEMNPEEVLKSYYQFAANDVIDDGSETADSNKAWFDVDKAGIKTFKNGAFARFDTAGGLQGVIGAVREGDNVGMLFLVTDKPDQYLDTFEAIIRSVRLTEDPLPEPTLAPTPTAVPNTETPTPLSINTPTATATYPTATPLNIITPVPVNITSIATIAVQPIAPVYPTATPFTTPTLPISPTPVCVYIVQEGDTLFSIAAALDVSPNDLIAENPSVEEGTLTVGQQLVIPGCSK